MRLIMKHHKHIMENLNAGHKLAPETINAVGVIVQMGKTPMAPVLLAPINIQLALRAHLHTALTRMGYVLVALLVMELAHTGNANTDLKLILDVIIQQIAILRLKGVYI